MSAPDIAEDAQRGGYLVEKLARAVQHDHAVHAQVA